ncbi:putative mitochondrial deoxyribose-phosphate aldolase [Leptomonas pyrrhocoris]|uniref:deoxyribose-phosphate aldolase n=1 Tax=Leptomonas pyrrhocoris TaxID=157538 RepID=A0A0M9G6S5_LEPPY|nr:putative mitochondrial deoxyribose-phosphate aldolase [Leptomonas pyrrhocoris]KPA83730.1 putative mitochondrial deoxyribose-phosphate aldolase [Leptomonas pyrrhocoris]|eukprot:XP_015662169.1 putative mitochondrial deoxyribose-phosphate aldolase [Leptomonas pyrrhocoris]
MTDLHMTARPGYTGQLNGKILERIRFLSKELDLPNLEDKFPHLKVTDGSWRRVASIPDDADLAEYIDHTQLKADAPHAAFVQLCDEAKRFHFKAVAVNCAQVKRCVELLAGSGVRVGGSVSFPLGQTTTAVKVAEAMDEVNNGALDMDMMLNVAELKNKDYRYIYNDIKAVCGACPPHVTTKVIFEICLLTEEEIIDTAIMCVAAGAHYVKTSTGFSTGGATPAAVDIMLAVVGNAALVKASGGIRDRRTALQFVRAGVRRIGTSAGVAICTIS